MDFTEEQLTSLRASLGLSEDAELSPDQVIAGLTALKTQADQKVAASSGNLSPDQMIVDKDAWESRTQRIERLEAVQKKHERDQRDVVIRQAVRDGKFAAASVQRYERMWDLDPDNAREVIASLHKNVVPVEDIGSGGGSADELLDEEYSRLFASQEG